MIIHDETGDPITASVNGAPPSSFRQRLVTFKIKNDADMLEFAKDMAKGRDIITQVVSDKCTFIIVRELIPTKIALAPSPSTGGQL